MNVIAHGTHVRHLDYLLDFLAEWEKRPMCLTPIAYQWCSAISEVTGTLGQGGTHASQQGRLRRTFWKLEEEFSEVGPGCDLFRLDDTSPSRELPQGLTPTEYTDLLFTTLEVGFRLAEPGLGQLPLRLNHTSNHNQMFEIAFSSDDDEVIADAVCAWITDGDCTPAGSCARYFSKRVESAAPFPPRLRRLGIRAIGRIWHSELMASASEMVHLLHRLDADVEDVEDKYEWLRLLVGVIRSPMGSGSLSSHYWHLLGKLTLATGHTGDFALRDMEVMRSLDEAEDWEKLEIWMTAIWRSLPFSGMATPELMEDIEQVTLKLPLRRPSALQRFENLCERNAIWWEHKIKLRGICDRVHTEHLPLEPPPPP